MSVKQILKPLALGIMFVLTQPGALAGTFRVQCSYQSENLERCADLVSDIVTNKFTNRYPDLKFAIFVHSDVHGYTNGGYVAYAVAGVVPVGSAEFPRFRVSSTRMHGDRRVDTVHLADVERGNFRAAVKELMDRCEVSPACDVYLGR